MLTDPSPTSHPAPVSPWAVPAEADVPRLARHLGATLGFVVAAVCVAIASRTPLVDSLLPPAWTLGPATLVAGSVGGWLIAPCAWRARSRAGWLGAVLLLSVVAVVIGDLVVVTLTASSLPAGGASTGTLTADGVTTIVPVNPFDVVGGAIELFVVGLLIVGPFAAIVTAVGAVAWAVLMAVARTVAARTMPGAQATS